MKEFKKGDRVRRTETGQTGTVRTQFIDGYVSVDFDNGRPGQLEADDLEPVTME